MKKFFIACVLLATACDSRGCSVAPLGFFFANNGVLLDLNLATPLLPTGMTGVRAAKSGPIYATNPDGKTVTQITGDAVYDCDPVSLLCGHWVANGWANNVPNATNLKAAGWTSFGTVTWTANAGTAPDGTNNATSYIDTSAASTAMLYNVQQPGNAGSGQDAISSVWSIDASSPPTATGAVYAYTNANNGYSWPDGRDPVQPEILSPSSTWHLVSSLYSTSHAVTAGLMIGIIPAGSTPVYNAYSTLDATQTGGVLVWGAQSHNNAISYPLVTDSTGQINLTLSAADLASIVDPGSGNFDIAVGFVGEYYVGGDTGATSPYNGWLWTMSTTGIGTVGVKFTATATVYNPSVNGVTVNDVDQEPDALQALTGLGGGLIEDRFQYNPTTGRSKHRVKFNGAFQQVISQCCFTTGVIGPISGFYLGSNVGNTAPFHERRYRSVTAYSATSANNITQAEGVMSGDSTFFSYSGALSMVGSWIYSSGEAEERLGINSIAVTGNTIAQQKAVWDASPSKGSSNVRWIVISLGINDINTARTEAQMIADMNSYLADINASNPNAVVFIAPMVPFNFTAANLTLWNAFNADLANPAVIIGTNTVRMGDWGLQTAPGSGQLQAQYVSAAFTPHENNAARMVMGADIRAELQATTCSTGFHCL